MNTFKNLIIRPGELAQQLGVSKVTLWRMEKDGKMPARIQISQKAVGWRTSEIEEWLNQRPTANEGVLK